VPLRVPDVSSTVSCTNSFPRVSPQPSLFTYPVEFRLSASISLSDRLSAVYQQLVLGTTLNPATTAPLLELATLITECRQFERDSARIRSEQAHYRVLATSLHRCLQQSPPPDARDPQPPL
jgi:hypothetical protein